MLQQFKYSTYVSMKIFAPKALNIAPLLMSASKKREFTWIHRKGTLGCSQRTSRKRPRPAASVSPTLLIRSTSVRPGWRLNRRRWWPCRSVDENVLAKTETPELSEQAHGGTKA